MAIPTAPILGRRNAIPDLTAPAPADPLEDLLAIPDPLERLGWLTERGRRLPAFASAERVPEHRVPGCVSAVWVIDESRNGVCRFRADAEAPVLRGLAGLICARASGRPPAAVAADPVDVVSALHLERQLTPTRIHGLRRLQELIRARASAHQAEGT